MKKLPGAYDIRMEAGFAAAAFREEFDDLLKRHDAKFQMGWEGKWAYAQVVFPLVSNELAVTIIKARKGTGACRYLDQKTEDAYEYTKSRIPIGVLLANGHELCPACERDRAQISQRRAGGGAPDALAAGTGDAINYG